MDATRDNAGAGQSARIPAGRPDSSRSKRWIVVLMLMLPILGGIWYTAVLAWNLEGRKLDEARLVHDQNSLRALLEALGPPARLDLAADGRIDVFGRVRDPALLRSERFGLEPTAEDLERGDYTRFAFQRHRGRVPAGADAVPLLWDPAPDRRRERLVGYSDGRVECVPDLLLRKQLREAGQE